MTDDSFASSRSAPLSSDEETESSEEAVPPSDALQRAVGALRAMLAAREDEGERIPDAEETESDRDPS